MKSLIPFLSLLVVASANAANPLGGNTVTCFKQDSQADQVLAIVRANRNTTYKKDPLGNVLNQITSVRSQDFYEATLPNLSGQKPELISSQENFQEIIEERLEKIRSMNIDYYKMVKEITKKIPYDRFIRSEAGVVEVDDSNESYIVPNRCLRLQIANQVQAKDGMIDITYDGRLFEEMDEVNKAALIFHEWFYRLMQDKGASDARAARLLTGFILRKDLSPALLEESMAILKRAGLGALNSKSDQLTINDIKFNLKVDDEYHYTLRHDVSGAGEFSMKSGTLVTGSYPSGEVRDFTFTFDKKVFPFAPFVDTTEITIPMKKNTYKGSPMRYRGTLNTAWNEIPMGKEVYVSRDLETNSIKSVHWVKADEFVLDSYKIGKNHGRIYNTQGELMLVIDPGYLALTGPESKIWCNYLVIENGHIKGCSIPYGYKIHQLLLKGIVNFDESREIDFEHSQAFIVVSEPYKAEIDLQKDFKNIELAKDDKDQFYLSRIKAGTLKVENIGDCTTKNDMTFHINQRIKTCKLRSIVTIEQIGRTFLDREVEFYDNGNVLSGTISLPNKIGNDVKFYFCVFDLKGNIISKKRVKL